jgi:hypothetical protein
MKLKFNTEVTALMAEVCHVLAQAAVAYDDPCVTVPLYETRTD